MIFTESRGNDGNKPSTVSFSSALLSPIASYGGIYSPAELQPLPSDFLQRNLASSYQQLALDLLTELDLDIDIEILRSALSLYQSFDDPDDPVPLVKIGDNQYVCELYHGPTRAFKDMALQPFGEILSSLASQREQQFLVLTATSGDTGPAALDTFRNRDNIRVVCLYPDGGTSDVQRLQMVTESAPNLKTLGIHGNFDDAQSALKSLLSSNSFNQQLTDLGISLSAANSVNFGRIIFQTIYHFHCYLSLARQGHLSLGEEITLHVPSGNFGNTLGGYYATRLGLPVAKIVVASNQNNVLTDWIQTGRYDLSKRDLIATTSPAMDILKSSNVERLLFDLFGAERTCSLMQDLDSQGWYQLDPQEHAQITTLFSADFCSDAEGLAFIKQSFEQGYLLDPHTATCLKSTQSAAFANQLNVIYSTAEWTKFASVVNLAITGDHATSDAHALRNIAKTAGVEIPSVITDLFDKPVIHSQVVQPNAIETEILQFLRAEKA